LNYRHAFHAGNFADCMKHALLVQLLRALSVKAAPFRVLDTHAGTGGYDLSAPEAERTGEWQRGILRLLDIEDGPLADYAALMRAAGAPDRYPGSPAIIRSLLRPQDHLLACELHPEDHAALRARFRRDPQVSVHLRDGWEALRALTPFPERRGLVLIDPPFEQKDEFEHLADAFAQAFAKWPSGSYLLWYPVKSRRVTDILARHVAEVVDAGPSPGKALRLEFSVAPQAAADAGLVAAGLLIVNPPWTLLGELKAILAELEKPLGQGGAGRFRLETAKP
jgi:23S rRNA (adenine2030-N6)-methyltransferase